MAQLTGKRVACLLTDGYEDTELTGPWDALTKAGATVMIVSPKGGEAQGKRGYTAPIDYTLEEISDADYDALIIPGGILNADRLRADSDAVAFTRAFLEAKKAVGVIGHSAWVLADAEVLKGRTVTSYGSVRTDIVNAGANWIDDEVVVDRGLVSARTHQDLDTFNEAFVAEMVRLER